MYNNPYTFIIYTLFIVPENGLPSVYSQKTAIHLQENKTIVQKKYVALTNNKTY